MACKEIISGYNLDCKEGQGGVYSVYIANVADISSITYSGDTLNISAISMKNTKKFFEFEQNEAVANAAANGTKNKQNSANQFEHIVNFNMVKIDDETIDLIDRLAKGKFVAIVHLNTQDKAVLFGWEKRNSFRQKGLEATVNNLVTGTAMTDLSGVNVTLQGLFSETASVLDASILTGLI